MEAVVLMVAVLTMEAVLITLAVVVDLAEELVVAVVKVLDASTPSASLPMILALKVLRNQRRPLRLLFIALLIRRRSLYFG